MNNPVITFDGLALQRQCWSDVTSARGTVLIVHGLGEHIGRYAHVAHALNAAGWRAVGYDQRGHGRSGGGKGQLATADALMRDLAAVIDTLAVTPRQPLLLLGHSMGGSVAARFVAEGLAAKPAPWYRPVDGLVLSSPAFDPGMNAGQKLLLALLGPLAPNLAVHNGVKPQFVSRDPQVVAAYRADPLVHDRVTPRLVRFILDSGALILQAAPRWCVPTLLLYAGSDRLVAARGSAAFAAAAPAATLEVQRFDALYHEILNEPEQGQVLGALHAWLARRNF